VDVGTWLNGLGLGEYARAFAGNDIDAQALATLSADDLKELGVASLGHRKKLLAAIEVLRAGQHEMPAPGSGQATATEGERRQVTVLFCDLAGYTEMTRDLGAERTHELTGRFFALADGIIERFGGTVDKHIGDCVMAVFGAPVAHGNDAERAVRAALEIRASLPQLAAAAGQRVAAHLGIASGQVVAGGAGGHRSFSITGESVNLASRLTDQASAGEILISDVVRETLAERLECVDLGMLEVKGIDRPIRAWRLLDLRDRPGVGRRPFVGRRSEIGQFEGALEACLETGCGMVVHVRGEAGIGKTRLVEEFRSRSEGRGFAAHTGFALDFGAGTGRDAIRGLVRSLLGLAAGGAEPAAPEGAERVLAEELISPERRVYLNDLLDLPQPLELRALYDAMDNVARNRGKRATVAELVERASARCPRLLVVEDVHWADPLILDHLASLAEVVARSTAVLVMTSRVEGDPIDQAWRSSTRGSPLMTIDLGPLRPAEAAALAGEYFDASTAFARRCVERAAGNPLFLEQLLRHAEESAESGVPGSVQSLVQARLDQLEPLDKQAVQAASVFGQRFDLEALRSLIGRADYDCGGLVARFLVRREGEDFLFAHALIRDAVYDSLLSTRRHDLHRRAADWFELRDPTLHAEHLDRAEDPRAAHAYLDAARRQAGSYHHDRALQLVERGLVLALDRSQTFALRCTRAELLRLLGQPQASIDELERALEQTDDEVERCRAWIGIAAGVRLLSGRERGIEVLRQAEAVAAGRRGLDREAAQLHYYWGSLLFAQADVAGCISHHRKALEHARRTGDPAWEARALSGLADGEYAQGRMHAALAYYGQCLDIAERHGFGQIDVANRYMLANLRRYLNDLTTALDEVGRAAEMARQVSNRRAEMLAHMLKGEFLIERGATQEAEASLARGYELAESLGNQRYQAYFRTHQARAMIQRGAVQDARGLLLEALDLSRRIDPRFVGPRLLGELALVARDPTERAAALAEGEEVLSAGCISHNWLWFHRDAIEASLIGGDWDGAERYAAALEELTKQEPLPWSDFFIARGRVLAQYGRGARDAATLQRLQQLQDQAAAIGLRSALPALRRSLSRSGAANKAQGPS
jgi:class 3 adenylate cyclase/tetratricopeptide (TPR) repeat protein